MSSDQLADRNVSPERWQLAFQAGATAWKGPISVHATLSSVKDLFDSGTTTSSVKKYWTTMGDGKYWIYFDWHVHS